MNPSLLQEFYDCNPNFEEKLNSLPEKYKNKFLRKLQKENNRIEFLSKVSEFHFLNFFVQEGFDFDYEPLINNKTPDLRIRVKGQEIIGDIKRFNLSEEDQIKERFFYELATQLKTINLPYYVHINQLECFSFELFDVKDITHEFYTWLNNSTINVGDIFYYHNFFEIEITNVTGIEKYVLFSYSTLENKIPPNKISSIVDDKIKYYNESIINKNFPFFVCIDLLFDSHLRPEDFEFKYHGGGALNIDTAVESFELGEFYRNELYSNLIGLLIRFNGKFHWIRNYRTKNYLELKLK